MKKRSWLVGIILLIVIIILSSLWLNKSTDEEGENGGWEDSESDIIDIIGEVGDEGEQGNNNEVEKPLQENQVYNATNEESDEISYGKPSGLGINKDMIDIARNLDFELYHIKYYLGLTVDDIEDVEEAYDILRGINLYLAADDVSYYDKDMLDERYQILKEKYIELKYDGATTKKYDEKKFGLNGIKPKSEKKIDSYGHLINANVLPARFFYPRDIIDRPKLLFLEQEEFVDIKRNDVWGAWDIVVQKSKVYQGTLNPQQKEDLAKINAVSEKYVEAVLLNDYNSAAKLMNKEFRESFGPSILESIKDGVKKEVFEFVPNYIDESVGLAVGYAISGYMDISMIENATGPNGELNEAEAMSYEIKFMSFRENAEGEWEIYFNVDTNFADYNIESFRE